MESRIKGCMKTDVASVDIRDDFQWIVDVMIGYDQDFVVVRSEGGIVGDSERTWRYSHAWSRGPEGDKGEGVHGCLPARRGLTLLTAG